MKIFFALIILSFSCIIQSEGMNNSIIKKDSIVLPKVFILGQYEKAYEKLYEQNSTVLLEVCNDDMDLAFDKWLGLLEAMEDYADEINYDIKGVKLWLNIFWNKSGSIQHIAFHLKSNSRNIDQQELTAFFSSFMNHYVFPVVATRDYSHYGSASFPTFSRRIKSTKPNETANPNKKSNPVKDSVGSQK